MRGRKKFLSNVWLAPAIGLLVSLALLLPLRLVADTVVTENGEYDGDVMSDDGDMVIMNTDRGIMYLRKDKIKAIMMPDFPKSSAKVQEITGTAEYRRGSGSGEWRELIVGTKLRPGDTVRTDTDSKVIATVASQFVIAVEANSELVIEDLRRSREGDVRAHLALDTGQLWSDVGALPSAKSSYRVETPQASCGVRGTIFTTIAGEDGNTTVGTVEGGVEVFQKEDEGIHLTVNANQQAVLGQSGEAEEDALDPELSGQWSGYESKFSGLRRQLKLEGLFERFGLMALLDKVGLSPTQGAMAIAGAGGVVILLGVVAIVRRKK